MAEKKYNAFKDLNLNDARMENETREEYKKRLRQNKAILKVYFKVGREAFQQMFPNGVSEVLGDSEEVHNKNKQKNAEKLGEAK